MYAYTFLLPSGESPNTSDISLPDDANTDADTPVPNSEPLMINEEEDNFIWGDVTYVIHTTY